MFIRLSGTQSNTKINLLNVYPVYPLNKVLVRGQALQGPGTEGNETNPSQASLIHGDNHSIL